MKKYAQNPDEKGAVLLLVTVLFTAMSMTILLGTVAPMIRQIQIARDFESSKKSYFAAEAMNEDAFYRLSNNLAITFPVNAIFDGATVVVTSTSLSLEDREIRSQGVHNNNYRTVLKDITVTNGFSFNFAVQVGNGSVQMNDNAVIVGNLYANSLVKANGNGTRIVGDVVSAGSAGVVDNVSVLGHVYARKIMGNSRICGNAYYQIINSASLSFLNNPSNPCPSPLTLGTAYPNSLDQPVVPMPIADSLLDQWESDATAGGITTTPCPYKITSGNVILGPRKINCNVEVSGNNTTVELRGAVWINGNLVINNNPTFKVSDTLGNKSVPIIARGTSNPTQNGLITLNNNPLFYGSETNGVPNPNSYVMLVSRNTGAEAGTGNKAIIAGNNITGNLLLYAPKGEIELSNNVILRSVTAYTLTLKNNVEVQYSIGLSQPLFTSGPGGEWKIKRWREI